MLISSQIVCLLMGILFQDQPNKTQFALHISDLSKFILSDSESGAGNQVLIANPTLSVVCQ